MGTLVRQDVEAMARVSGPFRGLPRVGWGHGVEPFPEARQRAPGQRAQGQRAPRQRAPRQRANDRTLGLWQELRGVRQFPTPDEAASLAAELRREAGDLEPNVFVVDFKDEPLQSVFTVGSPVLDSVCGQVTAARRMADCLPDYLRRSMLGFVKTMAKGPRPITVSSRFITACGKEMLYRSIYLPLGTDRSPVGHLLGAFSFKALPATA